MPCHIRNMKDDKTVERANKLITAHRYDDALKEANNIIEPERREIFKRMINRFINKEKAL